MSRILTVTPNPALDLATSAEVLLDASKIRCEPARIDPGGGGINVARVVHRLGGAVLALYLAGGTTGARLRGLLDAEGLASHCIDIAGETRESFSVWERATGREFRFVLPGPALEVGEWQALLDEVRKMNPAPAWVVASGSLPPGVPEDFYARLAEIARERNIRIALDASGPALAAALEAGVDIVKPNLRELRELTGRPLECEGDWLETLDEMIAAGKAKIIPLSAGHHGALAVSAEERLRASAVPVRVASSVGAGDSFLAGFVMRIANGDRLENALRQGVASGTAALLEWGTSLADPERVEKLLRQVMIERR